MCILQVYLEIKLPHKLSKVISISVIYILPPAVITAAALVILPEINASIDAISINVERYRSNIYSYIVWLSEKLGLSSESSTDRLTSLLYSLADYIPGLLSATSGLLTSFINIILGYFISVYIQFDFEKITGSMICCIKKAFDKEKHNFIISALHITAKAFSGFVSGQLTESVILGILCYIGMSLLSLNYPLLISVIIAVTSIVPIVGAIVGTIPCALLLLLEKPTEAFVFIVFIILLQQIESNFIYPHMIGTKIGLPPLLVLISVIVGGGFFGIIGTLAAVPVAASIYECIRLRHCDSCDTV